MLKMVIGNPDWDFLDPSLKAQDIPPSPLFDVWTRSQSTVDDYREWVAIGQVGSYPEWMAVVAKWDLSIYHDVAVMCAYGTNLRLLGRGVALALKDPSSQITFEAT
jgi:hypothetical protein